jgi:hypothetical protein
MATAALVPIDANGAAPAKARNEKSNYLGTLYEIASDLQALVDTEEMVPPELLAQFHADLTGQQAKATQKLNSIYGFLRHLALNQETLKTEITRLQRVKKSSENATDRMYDLVQGVIEALGPDAAGKYKKLKCDYASFFVTPKPSHLQVEDPEAVPAKFKTIHVELPLETWNGLLAMLHCDDASFDDPGYVMEQALIAAGETAKKSLDEKRVKAAIEAGEDVPGADLHIGELTLVVR